MRKLSFIIILFTIMGLFSPKAHGAKKEIDFNFPQDVSKNALADLKSALNTGNGELTVDALIRYSIAQSGISDENLGEIVDKIESTAKKEKRPEVKALLYYFEAYVFNSYMENGDVRYAETVEGEKPGKDYSEWNRDQFIAKREQLLALALADRHALEQVPVTSMPNIIKCNNLGALYVPTLFQFLALKCGDMSNDPAFKQSASEQYMQSVQNNVPAYIYAVHNIEGGTRCYEVYQQNIDNEHCGMLLENLWSRDDRYEITKDYLVRFPNGIYAPNASNIISGIEAKHANISTNRNIGSNKPITVKVQVKNVNKLTVNVFKVPDGLINDKTYSFSTKQLTKVASKVIEFNHTVPFEKTQEIELDGLDYGVYVIAPSYEAGGKTQADNNMSTYDATIVSDLAMFTVMQQGKRSVFVVNRETGAPVAGATVTFKRNNKSESVVTDKDGIALVPSTFEYCDAKASKGNDRYGNSIQVYSSNFTVGSSSTAKVFTDLGIYRPGEKVKWALVAYRTGDNSRSIIAGRSIEVQFYDSNNKSIATEKTKTDEFGRANGEFTVPTDRLNGNFMIRVVDKGDNENERINMGYKSVIVSEYKTPTFNVEFTTQRDAFLADAPVVIEGKATTYSGMPVAGCEVSLKLSKNEWNWLWRYYRPSSHSTAITDTIVTTDERGYFKVEFPADIFPENSNSRRYAMYNYSLNASCTNDAGETHEASKAFIVGGRSSIEMPDDYTHTADKPFELPITYNTTSDTEKSVACTYELINDKEEVVATGNFDTDKPEVDFTKVPSGEYTIKVHVLGTKDTDSDTNTKTSLVLYRVTDKQAPVKDCPLWIHVTDIKADKNGNANILIGTSAPEAYIYYVVASHQGVEKSGWLHYTPGMHQFAVQVPARDEEALNIEFFTYYKEKKYSKTARVSCPAYERSLNLEATSFRDKLVPGTPERWTFKVSDKDGKPVASALMLEMFDKALNTLANNTWSFNPGFSTHYKFSLNSQELNYLTSMNLSWQARLKNTASIEIPDLNTYDQILFGYMRKGFGGYQEMMVMDAAPIGARPMMKSAARTEAPMAVNAIQEAEVASEEGGVEEKSALDNVTMRMADVKTALWRPVLTTDADGNLVVEFDAPQFNTTWIVQAFAYDRDLYASSLNREVLTQKEVMVKSSLPRFVRTGDKATLAASVMNATDKALTADAVIELFDPRTDKVIATKNFNESLAANGTNAVSIDWDVPEDISFIGFRIKAASGKHSDGEQVMIPVLASTQPIIETQPFYIEQGAQGHTVTVPENARNARVTLEYCDNPTWYCVTALPALFDDNYQITTHAAHTLFTIDVAQGIANDNPKIKEAVDHWNANPQDSVLVSMLAKNQDLKIGTLLASPWVNESERQTLRMSQIGDLMDKDKMAAERKKVIDALLENQMSDGGFCWYKHPMAISSVYTTHTVLELIGEIKHLGYLSADSRLDDAVKRAVKYYDKEWLKIYNERKDKKNYDGFDDFVYVRTLFKDIAMDRNTQSLFNNSLKAMKKNWSNGLSLSSKAFFALTLERNGDHKTAAQITESIRQFAITKPALGMYWDNLQSGWRYFDKVAVTSTILQALNEVDHRKDEIDLVRKWILLMKQTNDWGSSSLAAAAVYSLLSTGTDWLQPASEVSITIDGKSLDIADAEKYLGYVRRTIDAAPGSVININRNGNSPAWGAIYNQFKGVMSETKQVSIDEMSISKQYYIYSTDGKLAPATSLKVGDKVQVRTIIKCNRDLDFVTVVDERASCFEPVDQISGYRYADGCYYYLETKDSKTNVFFSSLLKGTHIISYDVYVTAPGTYNAGVASAQCQYAPQIAAHSAGTLIEIKK